MEHSSLLICFIPSWIPNSQPSIWRQAEAAKTHMRLLKGPLKLIPMAHATVCQQLPLRCLPRVWMLHRKRGIAAHEPKFSVAKVHFICSLQSLKSACPEYDTARVCSFSSKFRVVWWQNVSSRRGSSVPAHHSRPSATVLPSACSYRNSREKSVTWLTFSSFVPFALPLWIRAFTFVKGSKSWFFFCFCFNTSKKFTTHFKCSNTAISLYPSKINLTQRCLYKIVKSLSLIVLHSLSLVLHEF